MVKERALESRIKIRVSSIFTTPSITVLSENKFIVANSLTSFQTNLVRLSV